MKKHILSICLVLALCLALLPGMALAAPGDTYLALGDSITTGYAPDGEVDTPFADQVAAAQGYTLDNQAAVGETSATLLAKLQNGTINFSGADLITITIGGNDLMNALYAYLVEEYNQTQSEDQERAMALSWYGVPPYQSPLKSIRRRNEMKKHILSICLVLALCLALLPGMALAAPGDTYLALGDSITTGYAPDGEVDTPFADQVAAAQGYTLDNQAAVGETSATLLAKLQNGTINFSGADLITITIGGNDLMNALYAYLVEEYNQTQSEDQNKITLDQLKAALADLSKEENQQLLLGIISFISSFNNSQAETDSLTAFESNLTGIIAKIQTDNPDAAIVIATQYNPYSHIDNLFATSIVTAFENGVDHLNQKINQVAENKNILVADVYQVFKTNGTQLTNAYVTSLYPTIDANLDFHPNQTGHDLIAEAINTMLPQQNYSLSVGGTTVTSRNANDVLDDGTVSYDAAANTLTLDNANLTLPDGSDRGAVIHSQLKDTLNIVVIGDNTITATGTKYCILSKAAGLTFSQDGNTPGKLTARAEDTHGCITCESKVCDVTFQSGTYDLYAKDSNVISVGGEGTLHITGTAEITAISKADDHAPVIGAHPLIIDGDSRLIVDTTGSAISCSGGEDYAFKLAGNAYVSIDGARGNYNVDLISSPLDDMLITDHATLECRSHNTYYEDWGYYNPVIYPGGSLYISGSASVTVEGPGDVIAPWVDLVFTGGTLTTVSQTSYGVWAPDGSIQISGPATILNTFTRDNDGNIVPSFRGIGAQNDVSITDGATVNAQTKDGLAIYSINKTNISGSVVDLGAEDGAKYYALWASGGLTIEDSWVRTDGVNAAPAVTDSVYICDETGSVYGTAAVPVDREIPAGTTLTIPADAVLTVADGVTLTNNGALTVEGILEVGSAAALTGAADVSGRVYVLEADGGANPVNGVTFTLSNSGQVYAQRTGLTGTTIQPAFRALGNYSYTLANGSAETFTNRWSYYTSPSGPSEPTGDYIVGVEQTTGGRVTVSPGRADKGDTVTITVRPNDGYVLDTLTVTDKDGDGVKVTRVSDTKYTFEMPASKVTVTAAFEKEGTASSLPFIDVDADDWFCEAVQYVYDNGIMNGVGDNRFAPNASLSRGMIAQVLYNLEQQPAAGSGNFTDVISNAWYADAVNWAAAQGIVGGYGNGQFGPEDNITREQLAAILYRYAQYKGYDVSVGKDTNILSYSDAQQVSEWAVPAMQWACGVGIIQGSGGALRPQGEATRAEVATMLMRLCEYYDINAR